MRFSKFPLAHDRPPPRRGEHTQQTLRDDLGMTDDEIDDLRTAGADA